MDDTKRTRQSLPNDPTIERGITTQRAADGRQVITFELQGVVSLEEYERAIHHWTELVRELSSVILRKKEIRWTIEQLSAGIALATIVGEADDPEDVERVEIAYAQIGHSLESGRPIPFPRPVRNHATALLRLVDESKTISALRFASTTDNITIFPRRTVRPKPEYLVSFGEIEGTIETLSGRKKLGFTLYDAVFDRAVFCSLHRGQQALVADKWEQFVSVRGMISRDPTNGRPFEMFDIVDVRRVKRLGEGGEVDSPFIEGLLPLGPEDETTDSILRRLRDEW